MKKPVNRGERPKTRKASTARNPSRRTLTKRSKETSEKSVRSESFESPWGSPAIIHMDAQELEREKLLLSETFMQEHRALGLSDFWYFCTRVVFPDIWRAHYT